MKNILFITMLLGALYADDCTDCNSDCLGEEAGCGSGMTCMACCDCMGSDFYMCSSQQANCDACGGTWNGTSECPINGSAHLEIQNVNLTEGTLDIYMTNDVDVYALQVVFTGLTDNCTSGCDDGIISVIPGEIVPDDWYLWGADDEILGFDINMSPISAGQGILATIIFADNISDDAICIPLQYNCTDGYNEDTCYLDLDGGGFSVSDDNPVLSDAYTNSIPVTVGDCYVNDNNWIYGCTYETATNYNAEATFDDGSCDFMWGDVNHDGQLTIQDLILIVNEILNF